jgi:hypothetical protein
MAALLGHLQETVARVAAGGGVDSGGVALGNVRTLKAAWLAMSVFHAPDGSRGLSPSGSHWKADDISTSRLGGARRVSVSPDDADHGMSWRMKVIVKYRNSNIAMADSTQHVLSSGVNVGALEKWSLRKSTSP